MPAFYQQGLLCFDGQSVDLAHAFVGHLQSEHPCDDQNKDRFLGKLKTLSAQ